MAQSGCFLCQYIHILRQKFRKYSPQEGTETQCHPQLIHFHYNFRKYSPREGTETSSQDHLPFFHAYNLGNTVPERGRKPQNGHGLRFSINLGNTVPERGRKLPETVADQKPKKNLGNTVPERGRKHYVIFRETLASVQFRKYSPREGTETQLPLSDPLTAVI